MRWVKLSVNDRRARRRIKNSSLKRKVEVKRWLRKAAGLVQADAEMRMRNLVAYGTTHPELLL